MRGLKILPFALLAIQVAIPWSVPNFVTQDGPSHLYTAAVTRELVLHPDSHYSAVYRLNSSAITNWASVVLFSVGEWVAGYRNAEKVVASICLIAGFFALTYALGAPTPIANLLLQNWFFAMGFYNFVLGMALFPALVAYAMRRTDRIAWIAVGLVGLFFVHPFASGVAMAAIAVIRARAILQSRAHFRELIKLALACVPALALFAWFALASRRAMQVEPAAEGWWSELRNLFSTAPGSWMLVAVVLLSIALMSRKRWAGQHAASAMTALAFIAGLVVPASGFGGSFFATRLLWAALLLGALLFRTNRFENIIGICAALAVGLNLAVAWRGAHEWSGRVDEYLSSMKNISKTARFIRIRYPEPDRDPHQPDPLFHLDALIASGCRCVDLSDYQAPNGVFPVAYRESFSRDQQADLWSLEMADRQTGAALSRIFSGAPVTIDYAMVFADGPWPRTEDERRVLQELESRFRLIERSERVRLYGPQ
jgi:hypothetical protein